MLLLSLFILQTDKEKEEWEEKESKGRQGEKERKGRKGKGRKEQKVTEKEDREEERKGQEENKEEELSINEQLQSSYELIQMLGNYIPKDYSLILTNTTIQSRNDKTSLKASINPSQINLTILTKKETLEVNLQNKQNTLFGNINLRTPEIKSKIQSKIILSEKIEFHLKPDIHFLKLEKTLQDKISNPIN